jgi:hypothetical protein
VRGDSHAYDEAFSVGLRIADTHNDPFPGVLPGRFDGHRAGLGAPGLLPDAVEPTVLDFEKTCKVRIHGERNLAGCRLQGIVVNRDVLHDAGTQFALPFHSQRTIGPAVGSRGPPDVCGLIGGRGPGAKWFQGLSVYRE